jgi:hypothetical protein
MFSLTAWPKYRAPKTIICEQELVPQYLLKTLRAKCLLRRARPDYSVSASRGMEAPMVRKANEGHKVEVRAYLAPEIATEIKVLAVREGRAVKELVEEACAMLIEKRLKGQGRAA